MQRISENALRKALLITTRGPEGSAPADDPRAVSLLRESSRFWTAALQRVLDGSTVDDALAATRDAMVETGWAADFANECMERMRPHLTEAVGRADAIIRAAVQFDEHAA